MWNKIKDGIGKLPYKYVICLCILCLVSIMLVAFAVYIYLDYQRQRRETAGREAEHSVSQMVTQVDERLDNLKQYYISFVDGDDFRWVLENDLNYSDYKENIAALEIMSGKKIFMDYIGSFFFVNFRTGWVLSSIGMFPLDEVENSDVLYELFERNSGSLDKNYWLYDENTYVERVTNYRYHINVRKEGISLVMTFSNLVSNPSALFMVNINMNTWEGWIERMLGNRESLVILAPDGKAVYATDERLVESCRKLQKESGEEKSREVKLGGGIRLYGIFRQVFRPGVGILYLL